MTYVRDCHFTFSNWVTWSIFCSDSPTSRFSSGLEPSSSLTTCHFLQKSNFSNFHLSFLNEIPRFSASELRFYFQMENLAHNRTMWKTFQTCFLSIRYGTTEFSAKRVNLFNQITYIHVISLQLKIEFIKFLKNVYLMRKLKWI